MRRPSLIAPTGRRTQRATAVVVALVLLGGLVALVIPRLTALPDDVAIRVADTDVTKAELERRTKLLDALYGIGAPPDEAGKDAYRRETARAIATSVTLDRAAAERNIVIPDKVARDSLTRMVEEQLAMRGGREAYVKLLADAGASEGDVLEEIKRQQATQQLFGQVAGRAGDSVTDVEVRNHYRDHPEEVTVPELRRLRNVVVASEPEAADVLRRVTTGEDFGAVAQQSSLDQSTRAQGGDLGGVARAQLDPAFGDAAFGAAPGAVFGPVKTQSGWNVGQVLEVRPPSTPPFEQVAAQLTEKLRSDRSLGVWRGWVDERIRDADIEYADEFRPADADRPKPQAAASGAPGAVRPVAAATVAPGGDTAAGPSPLTPLATGLIMGVAFFGIGVWGRRNLDELVPTPLPEQQRAKRRRVLRRGTVFCMAAACVLVALSVVGFVHQIF